MKIPGKVWLLLVLLGPALLAGPAPAEPPPAGPPAVQRFEGNLSATGTRQVLAMEPGRQAAILHLSGSLVLDLHEDLSRGFRCEAISFYDGRERALGESAWTDERGDQVFSRFEAKRMGTGALVTGTITGGTGRYAGLTGRYEYTWQYVLDSPDGTVQGRAVGLKGEVRRGAARPAPPPKPQVP
jgi:hypothetical protein